MSFSSKSKEELCRIPVKRSCCRVAALSSFLQMAGVLQLGVGGKSVKLTTESYAVARWGVSLAKKAYDMDAEIQVREHKRLGKTRSFAVVLSGENIDRMLLDTSIFQIENDCSSISGGVPKALYNRENECCRRAFLRGAFLGGGSLNNPSKGYHLEFVARTDMLAEELSRLLNYFSLNAKIVLRKGNNVVYLKESDKIIELLTLIGAHTALLDLENVIVYKDFRNNINRKVNCEAANIQKTVDASQRQIESIRFLLQNRILDGMSEEMRQTAEARVNNPNASLSELGELLSRPVGKSGVNHRLRKLEELAEHIRLGGLTAVSERSNAGKEKAHGTQGSGDNQ